MTTATTFYGLFQAEYESEDDATLVAVFSKAKNARKFGEKLSEDHTALKLEANDRRAHRLPADDIPDLYWDVRPVAFDPRSVEELL